MKTLKENIVGIITIIVLVIVCFIVLGAEYFVFMNPITSRRIVFFDPTPTNTAKVSISTDEILIGEYLDDWGYSPEPDLIHTIIIKKVNGVYYKTEIFKDGSQGTIKLNVKVVNGEERLIEEGDDGYFGDYMVIENNRDIAFYDKKGFIYRLHPK